MRHCTTSLGYLIFAALLCACGANQPAQGGAGSAGTKDTVGVPLQQATYATTEVQTFLARLTGADHYFFGGDCVLCQAPWEKPQRKNWP